MLPFFNYVSYGSKAEKDKTETSFFFLIVLFLFNVFLSLPCLIICPLLQQYSFFFSFSVGSFKEVRRIETHFPLYQASIFSIEFHPIQFSLLIPISSILESCNPARFSLCTISNSPELSENIFNVKKYFQCEKISQLACGSVHGSQGSKNWIINGLVALT